MDSPVQRLTGGWETIRLPRGLPFSGWTSPCDRDQDASSSYKTIHNHTKLLDQDNSVKGESTYKIESC